MNNNDIQDKIDRYVMGRMSAEERADFEANMAADPSLDDEVRLTQSIKSSLGDIEEKRRSIARFEDERRYNMRMRLRRKVLSAVTVAAACAIAIFLIVMPDADNGGDAAVVRGGLVSDSIVKLIDNKRYAQALQAISVAEADTLPTDTTSAEAIESERAVISMEQYRLRWLKIKALVGLQRYDEALPLLRQYAKETGEYQSAAKEMLKRLSR